MKTAKIFASSVLILAFAFPGLAEVKNAAGIKSNQADLNAPCIQSAVDKRDTAIIAAVDAYSSATKSAISARKDALKAAWAQTDRKTRRDAIAVAWKNHKDAAKTANKAYRQARLDAWKNFNTDRKSCGKSATSDDSTGQGVDALSE